MTTCDVLAVIELLQPCCYNVILKILAENMSCENYKQKILKDYVKKCIILTHLECVFLMTEHELWYLF
jgi:hypothetical protein